MTSYDKFSSVPTLCIPQWDLPSIARISLCSNQLAQLCSAHLTAGNQQQAARLLLQAVHVAAEDVAQRHQTTPAFDPIHDGDWLVDGAEPSPDAHLRQQEIQHQQLLMCVLQHTGPITWLLSAVDSTSLLDRGTTFSKQLRIQLASIPNVPSAVALLLVNAGLHVSCSQIVEAATAGPLPGGVGVWLQPWRAWCDKEGRHPLAMAVGVILGASPLRKCDSLGMRQLLAQLSTAELITAALVAIRAPRADCAWAKSALSAYRRSPAAHKIDATDMTKLMSAIVDRFLHEQKSDKIPFDIAWFIRLCTLPVVQQIPSDAVCNFIGRAVAAGRVDVVYFLCGDGASADRDPRLPVWRLDRAAVDKLKLLAADACMPVAQTGMVPSSANTVRSEVLYLGMLVVLSKLPVHTARHCCLG